MFRIAVQISGLAASKPQPDGRDVDLWQALVAVGVVVSLIAGIQQIAITVKRRRYAKAEEKMLQTIARTLDAEAAEQDVAKYVALRESLRRQIEDEVPLEGRRVYLRARLDELRDGLASDVQEFERLRAELQSLDDRKVEPLDARLRAVVEDSIRPRYVQRRRFELAVFALLGVLLVTALSPNEPRRLLHHRFNGLSDSAYASAQEVATSVVLFSLVACLASYALLRSTRPRIRILNRLPALWGVAGATSVLASALLSFGAIESNRATRLLNKYQYERGERLDTVAAALLWPGTVALGIASALWLIGLRLQRQRREVRRQQAPQRVLEVDDSAESDN